MRSWNSPGSHIFGCWDVSGILGNFLDVFLLGIITGMEKELNPQCPCFFLVQVLFDLWGCCKYCGFSESSPYCGRVTECGPVLECSSCPEVCRSLPPLCSNPCLSPQRNTGAPWCRKQTVCDVFVLSELLEPRS